MTRLVWSGMLMVALSLSAGCVGDLTNGGRKQTANAPTQLPPASEAASTGAFEVFSKLFAENPEIGAQLSPTGDANFRPFFRVVGWPCVGILHKGSTELYITEGLVNRCPPEGKDGNYQGKLAAVLASELSKMVIEADYQKGARILPNTDQVFATQVPGDNSDHTDLAAQAIVDKNNPRTRNSTRPPINQDPNLLARNYLSKANFSPSDLMQVSILIRQAENNQELQKQLNPQSSGLFGR